MSTETNRNLETKLLTLCDKQLAAMLSDAEILMRSITDSSLKATKHVSKIDSADFSSGEDTDNNSEDSMKEQMAKVVESLQFFDVFSQRIDHVRTLINMVISDLRAVSDLDNEINDEEVAERVRHIFSIQAELDVFEELFPGAKKTEYNGLDCELF